MRASRKLARPLAKPLREAVKASGITLADLVRKAGLKIDESSMSRKLSGDQSIGIPEEAEKLGAVVGLRLRWDERARSFTYEQAA